MKKQRVTRRGVRELVIIFPVDELDIYEQIDRLIYYVVFPSQCLYFICYSLSYNYLTFLFLGILTLLDTSVVRVDPCV